jgi:hypothetical protein
MEAATVESIPIVVGREEDNRWWADIESMPGVMAYGVSRHSAIAAVRALHCALPQIASSTVSWYPSRSLKLKSFPSREQVEVPQGAATARWIAADRMGGCLAERLQPEDL